MKKLLQSTIVLSLFTISIVIFDLSCKKESKAAVTTTSTNIPIANQMLFMLQDGSIGIEGYDGYNVQKVNIFLPSGVSISTDPHLAISPDHKTIFFSATDKGGTASNPGLSGGYSCNIDGTNVKKIDYSAVHVPF